jgi:hypothetical protein
MMWAVLRNLRSRLLRTSLTATGIAIGILALVVVGGLAERLHTIVAGSSALNTGAIFAFAPVTDVGSEGGSLDRSAATIRTFPGVRSVVAEVILPYSSGNDGRFGPPALIFGFPRAPRRRARRRSHAVATCGPATIARPSSVRISPRCAASRWAARSR